MGKKKVILIGWDAADWQVINPLLEAGELPALQHLIENGVSGNLATLEPVFSPMLWTSIATGKLADKHGVLGFSEPDLQHGGVKPVSTASRKTAAIWNILSSEQYKTNVVGWWPSHPAEPLNGIMVSNFYQKVVKPIGEKWPMPPSTVFPQKYSRLFAELRIHPNELTAEHILPFIPKANEIDQDKDKRLNMFSKILSEAANIHNAATWLIEKTEWDFMAVYYDNIDHFSHGFMKYHPPKMKGIKAEDFELYKNVINSAYKFHDMMLGRILNLTDEHTTVMLISDHGFESGSNRLPSLPKEAAAPAYDHRSYGIFAAMGPGIKKDELVFGANLLDITPTLLHYLDLPLGKDMDGKPLLNIFSEQKALKYIDSWDDIVKRDVSIVEDKETAAEALKMLIELGYIEKPSEKSEEAFEKSKLENDFNLARVYLSSARAEKAAEILEKLHQKENSLRIGLRLAIAYETLGRYKKSIALYETLEKESKQPIQQLLALKASAYVKINQNKKAFDCIQPLLNKKPHTPLTAKRVAQCLIDLKKQKLAFQYLSKALIYHPENASLVFLKGLTSFKRKQYADASDDFLDAINNQFHHPKAHFYLAESLYFLKEYKSALEAYQVAAQQNPKQKKALQRIAQLETMGIEIQNIEKEWLDYSGKNPREIKTSEQAKVKFLEGLDGLSYIVSGLPRSGTSMMMQMLQVGGAQIFSDNKRKADKHNPKGYLEHEGVKRLAKNPKLILEAKGKVVKVVSAQLPYLLPRMRYKIIFMQRKVSEVVSSQQKMRENKDAAFPIHLIEFYEKQLKEIETNILEQIHVDFLKVDYHDTINNPKEIARQLAAFLPELSLNTTAMAGVIEPSLYRNRSKNQIKE